MTSTPYGEHNHGPGSFCPLDCPAYQHEDDRAREASEAQESAGTAMGRLLGHFGLDASTLRDGRHDHSLADACTPACRGYAEVQRQKRQTMMAEGAKRRFEERVMAQQPDGSWEPAEPIGWQGFSGKIEGWLRDHPGIPGAVRVANALGRWEERGLG